MRELDAAARVIRAGSNYSAATKKLRDAVWKVIEYLTDNLEERRDIQMYTATGWSFYRKNNSQCMVKFRWGSNEYTVTTNSDDRQFVEMFTFCYALANEEGEKLVGWISKETKHLEMMTALMNIRGTVVQKDQKDKEFVLARAHGGEMIFDRWSGDTAVERLLAQTHLSVEKIEDLVSNCQIGTFLSLAHHGEMVVRVS